MCRHLLSSEHNDRRAGAETTATRAYPAPAQEIKRSDRGKARRLRDRQCDGTIDLKGKECERVREEGRRTGREGRGGKEQEGKKREKGERGRSARGKRTGGRGKEREQEKEGKKYI